MCWQRGFEFPAYPIFSLRIRFRSDAHPFEIPYIRNECAIPFRNFDIRQAVSNRLTGSLLPPSQKICILCNFLYLPPN